MRQSIQASYLFLLTKYLILFLWIENLTNLDSRWQEISSLGNKEGEQRWENHCFFFPSHANFDLNLGEAYFLW